MRYLLQILFIALLAGTSQAEPLEDMSQSELKQRLSEIDNRLAQLARSTLRSGVGPIGYRSFPTSDATQPNWIEIDLPASVPVDQIILVPTIWRNSQTNFHSDAFPPAFRILNEQGELLAEVRTTEKDLPRIAPLIVPTFGQTAAKIRIETDSLSRRAFDGNFILQFAEVLVFSGTRNVALRQPVRASRSMPYHIDGWHTRFLTDGSLPYQMHAAEGAPSTAYLSPPSFPRNKMATLSIDLQRSFPVSAIHLHLIELGDTVPQAQTIGMGMPHKLLIEGANQANFSDARQLLEVERSSVFDISPVMRWNLPETSCRYIRLTAIKPYLYNHRGQDKQRIGFAEIEIYANGSNIALGKPIEIDARLRDRNRPVAALTDGRNTHGNILPQLEWLEQLAERYELETQRPLITAELERRYASQKSTVRIMSWLFALSLAVVIIVVLVERNIRQRAIFRTREQIAADLHDELGANLHAIGMLGDLVQKAQHSPERLTKLLQRMWEITDRTGRAARYCVNMLEDKQRFVDLAENMRRTAARMTADLDHELTFEGESLLTQLSARKRIDLFLFYKECLTNIIRHSSATHVTTHLTIHSKHLELIITDNGSGLNGDIPSSLKRRARILGGHVSTSPHQPSGTQIQLRLRFRRRLRSAPNTQG